MMEKRDLLFVAVESTGSEPYPSTKTFTTINEIAQNL